jgi:large subunit ribosomal protein L7Ae
MAPKKTQQKKKLPAAPLGASAPSKVKKHPLFEKKARSFRIGGDIQPKRDLTRFTRWPLYVRLQRQKRILLQRLKVPPTIAQFQHTLDKSQFTELVRLLKKYQPETGVEKKLRLRQTAESQAAGKADKSGAVPVIKYGLNHVTSLVENKKAKLVVIAHDVDPVELVCWLPALCRKKDVPYCIVKGKSRLGKLVHQKTASCLALTQVGKDDVKDLNQMAENFKAQFNDNKEVQRRMGGGQVGVKSMHIRKRRQAALDLELAKKTGLLG